MTEAFDDAALNEWRDTLDLGKISRQLQSAKRNRGNPNGKALVHAMDRIYLHIGCRQYAKARSLLQQLDTFLLNAFGWNGVDVLRLPRPFDKPYLAILYWQAQRALLGVKKPQPRRSVRVEPW